MDNSGGVTTRDGVDDACRVKGLSELHPLESRFPDMSARHLKTSSLIRSILITFAVLIAAVFAAPAIVMQLLFVAVAMGFLCISLLRCAGIYEILSTRSKEYCIPETGEPQPSALPCQMLFEPLPRYAVLVALYKEAPVVGQIVKALNEIDYPKNRLQVSLVVETDDQETLSALEGHDLGDHMRIVVVPNGVPRTKPRALNFALSSAVGDYVVVYDAEDLPEPDQLRRALQKFGEDGGRTGCVQARLGIYNSDASFYTRQFTIEYSALFKAILPALERYGLPVPLGGTSNHFPTRVLKEAGGWDAFNVTEDADLGIRLARLGYNVRVISSTTWEEAPPTFAIWLRQRTRWLKGWMQTYLVHMRRPLSLWRGLGAFRFAGFQILMGGMILSALIHPWFYAGLAYTVAARGGQAFTARTSTETWLLGLAVFNLLVGYLSAVVLGALAAGGRHARSEKSSLARQAIFMPIYWLMISFAGYRALWQLATSPFIWEKTPHVGKRAGCENR